MAVASNQLPSMGSAAWQRHAPVDLCEPVPPGASAQAAIRARQRALIGVRAHQTSPGQVPFELQSVSERTPGDLGVGGTGVRRHEPPA